MVLNVEFFHNRFFYSIYQDKVIVNGECFSPTFSNNNQSAAPRMFFCTLIAVFVLKTLKFHFHQFISLNASLNIT